MYNRFIPSFHFTNPSKKMTKDWCWDAVQYTWYNTNNRSLLHGKNVAEIMQYATGDIDSLPFKRMYKSVAKKLDQQKGQNYVFDSNAEKHMQFNMLPLIPSKLNSAIATMQKVPFEVTVKAMDALAAKKKADDINFLKNKPDVEADLQEIADKMGLGKVDLGTTKHSNVPYSSSPYGIDLNQPDESQVFENLIYSLAVEASFETCLQIFYELKNLIQLRLMETRDHFWYGVSTHCAFESDITGLPDSRYIYPGNMFVPHSDLPDYSDRSHEFEEMCPTVMELFNMFGSEIKNLETLMTIINGKEFGYCDCNKRQAVPERDWGTFKTSLVYCKVKSVDWIGVKTVTDSEGNTGYTFTDNEDEAKEKVWAQNTYCFYWLKNTKYFFAIDKLGFATRKNGQEQYQGFDTNIYRSQYKSAVEQSIGENKKAIVASIKMEHTLIKSMPPGGVLDIKGMRNALDSLKEKNDEYTMDTLINLAMEENWQIIDTEDFNGKNDGQLKPFYERPGGLNMTVIAGYETVIDKAKQRISEFTGINEQLTGTSANPEGLIGLQKLLINSSINALYYIQEGMTAQYQRLMNIWAYIIKDAVEEGGATKEAIVNMIGKEKTELIDGLSDLPLHDMGVKITLTQREEERAKYEMRVAKLDQLGVLTTADIYMLDEIQNPKDKVALLAVKEIQFRKRKAAEDEQKFAQQQQLMQQQGQNQQAAVAAETQGEKEVVYAKGDVQSKILTLANSLGMSELQMDGLIKRALQRDRGVDQERKAVNTVKAKQTVEAQAPLV
jgi:hypothetical protein